MGAFGIPFQHAPEDRTHEETSLVGQKIQETWVGHVPRFSEQAAQRGAGRFLLMELRARRIE